MCVKSKVKRISGVLLVFFAYLEICLGGQLLRNFRRAHHLRLSSVDRTNFCPRNFEYRYDNRGGLYGRIVVDCPNANIVNVTVELSVGNQVNGNTGKLELALGNKEQLLQTVQSRRPLEYNLMFPYWERIPPRITKIFVNGQLICSGPAIPLNTVPFLTTVFLHHALTIYDTNELQLNKPENNAQTNGGQFYFNNFKFEIPAEKNEDLNFDARRGLETLNQVLKSPNVNNQIKFNPQMPRNGVAQVHSIFYDDNGIKTESKKVYPENPFLNNFASNSFTTAKNPIWFDVFPATQAPEIKTQNFEFQPAKRIDIPNISNFNPRSTLEPSVPVTLPTIRTTASVPNTPPIIQTTTSVPPTRFDQDTCGISTPTNKLIVYGSDIPRGAYPWLGAMFSTTSTGVEYRCSSTLISKRHAVTAAHCLFDGSRKLPPREILLVLGKMNLQRWTRVPGERFVEAEKVYIHPNYQGSSADADIAVILFNEELEFSKYVSPVCLWTTDPSLEFVVGKVGVVIGWGKDENGQIMTADPKQSNVPIVSQEVCLRSSYSFNYITSNKTFCGGYRNGTGPCNGDSGSGFIIEKDGRWFLRGVVSMSLSEPNRRTCDLSHYVVFTDTAKYLEWLLNIIK